MERSTFKANCRSCSRPSKEDFSVSLTKAKVVYTVMESDNNNTPSSNNNSKNVQKKCSKKVRECFLVSRNSRIYSRVRQAHRGVEEERIRHIQTYPGTIHPYSDFRWYWDIFMTFVLMITLIGQPLQIAFYAESMEHIESAVVALIISIIFSLDIFLNFRTGYVCNKTDDIILNPSEVTKKYFKTWFFVDLISTIPFDSIYVAINDFDGDGELYFRFFRLLELLKILRLARVIRYLGRIERAYTIPNVYARIINLLVIIFFLLHWLACLHFLVSDFANSYPYHRKELSWISQMDLWDRPVWEQYLHSLLRALSNMGSLGYGYVAPRTPEDVIATLTAILIGATCFALFIANISNIVLNLDSSQKKYTDCLNQTIAYLNFKHIPKSLQNDVIVYFEQRYRRNLFNEEEILGNVSDVLRQKIKMFNCQRLVEQLPLFHGFGKEILYGIVAQLRYELYLPKDIIIVENTVGTCMYFIEHGIVNILDTNGRIINELKDGNFFGEMSLVTNESRAATVIAKATCEVYKLEKEDFQKVVSQYPEIYANILKVAKDRQRLKKLSQSNGICINSNNTVRPEVERPHKKNMHELDFNMISE